MQVEASDAQTPQLTTEAQQTEPQGQPLPAVEAQPSLTTTDVPATEPSVTFTFPWRKYNPSETKTINYLGDLLKTENSTFDRTQLGLLLPDPSSSHRDPKTAGQPTFNSSSARIQDIADNLMERISAFGALDIEKNIIKRMRHNNEKYYEQDDFIMDEPEEVNCAQFVCNFDDFFVFEGSKEEFFNSQAYLKRMRELKSYNVNNKRRKTGKRAKRDDEDEEEGSAKEASEGVKKKIKKERKKSLKGDTESKKSGRSRKSKESKDSKGSEKKKVGRPPKSVKSSKEEEKEGSIKSNRTRKSTKSLKSEKSVKSRKSTKTEKTAKSGQSGKSKRGRKPKVVTQIASVMLTPSQGQSLPKADLKTPGEAPATSKQSPGIQGLRMRLDMAVEADPADFTKTQIEAPAKPIAALPALPEPVAEPKITLATLPPPPPLPEPTFPIKNTQPAEKECKKRGRKKKEETLKEKSPVSTPKTASRKRKIEKTKDKPDEKTKNITQFFSSVTKSPVHAAPTDKAPETPSKPPAAELSKSAQKQNK